MEYIDGLIQEFLKTQNLSESSIDVYENVLMIFGTYFRENNCAFENITETDIFKSLDFYISERKIKYENTARFYLSAVKDFIIFNCKKQGGSNKNLLSKFGYGSTTEGFEDKVSKNLNSLISNDVISSEKEGVEITSNELQRLIDKCDDIINEFKVDDLESNIYNGRYSKYLSALGVKILAYTGIKVGVLLHLENKCISNEGCIEIMNRNTKKIYSVKIPETLYKQITFYYNHIRKRLIELKNFDNPSDYLLIDFKGKPLSNKPFNNLIYETIGSNKEMGSATARLSKRAIIDMMTAGMSVKIIDDLTGYGDKVLDYCKEKADEIKKEEKDINKYIKKYIFKRDQENSYYRDIFRIQERYESKEINQKYGHELQDIKNKLQQLEDGRIYDLTKAQMDGYLSTNIKQLKKMIDELIYKIEYNEESTSEKLGKAFEKSKI